MNAKTAAAKVDFTVPQGMLRHRLHSSGYMPNISMQNISDSSDAFAKLRFLEARTHDQALTNPGQRVVDTHFLFPNMNTDPADPANYFFAATDHLLQTCLACGTGIMYRLGTSIEHTRGRHFNAIMPDDFEKYAEVLAGIVRHYNHGWADGFHWDIRYWEIWNEADLGQQMWSGTVDDYCRLYVVAAKRLKKEFPEIKIGGPAFCNFEEPKFTTLLAACQRHEAPLDYISWHGYTADVADLVAVPSRARRLLDSMGFTETETMINEWHYLLSWDGLHHNFTPEGYEKAMSGPAGMFGIDSAAFNVSVIAGWHDTPLDSAYYYGCGEGTWGFVTMYKGLNKNYHSMYLVGQMMSRFPHRVSASGEGTVSVLAGTDGDSRAGLLVADYRGNEPQLELVLDGVDSPGDLKVLLLDQASDLKSVNANINGNRLVLPKDLPGSAVFLVTFTNRRHSRGGAKGAAQA